MPYRISCNKCQASNKCCTPGYPHWNKPLPLISATSLNTALIRIATIFYKKLNQNAHGPSMQTIKQWKYWYLGFFIFSLLIVKNYVSFLSWKKKWQDFAHFPNFEISVTLSNKHCTSQFQNLISAAAGEILEEIQCTIF